MILDPFQIWFVSASRCLCGIETCCTCREAEKKAKKTGKFRKSPVMWFGNSEKHSWNVDFLIFKAALSQRTDLNLLYSCPMLGSEDVSRLIWRCFKWNFKVKAQRNLMNGKRGGVTPVVMKLWVWLDSFIITTFICSSKWNFLKWSNSCFSPSVSYNQSIVSDSNLPEKVTCA